MHVVLHENEILGMKVMMMEKFYILSGVLWGEESSDLALIARMRSIRDRRRSTVTQKKRTISDGFHSAASFSSVR